MTVPSHRSDAVLTQALAALAGAGHEAHDVHQVQQRLHEAWVQSGWPEALDALHEAWLAGEVPGFLFHGTKLAATSCIAGHGLVPSEGLVAGRRGDLERQAVHLGTPYMAGWYAWDTFTGSERLPALVAVDMDLLSRGQTPDNSGGVIFQSTFASYRARLRVDVNSIRFPVATALGASSRESVTDTWPGGTSWRNSLTHCGAVALQTEGNVPVPPSVLTILDNPESIHRFIAEMREALVAGRRRSDLPFNRMILQAARRRPRWHEGPDLPRVSGTYRRGPTSDPDRAVGPRHPTALVWWTPGSTDHLEVHVDDPETDLDGDTFWIWLDPTTNPASVRLAFEVAEGQLERCMTSLRDSHPALAQVLLTAVIAEDSPFGEPGMTVQEFTSASSPSFMRVDAVPCWFHGTSEARLANIAAAGIGKVSLDQRRWGATRRGEVPPDVVYLADNRLTAIAYADKAGQQDGTEPVILEIDATVLPSAKAGKLFVEDWDFHDTDEYGVWKTGTYVTDEGPLSAADASLSFTGKVGYRGTVPAAAIAAVWRRVPGSLAWKRHGVEMTLMEPEPTAPVLR